MRRGAAWTAALAVLAVALFAAAAGHRYAASGALAEDLRRTVVSRLHTSLGRDVRLGAVRGDLVHGVSLHDLRIAEAGGFARGVAFSADEVRLSLNWWALAAPRPDPVNVITQARLMRPRLVIDRAAAGRWNFDDLFARPATQASPFRGRILVEAGAVVFRDAYKVPAPFAAVFEGLRGDLGFARRDEISLTLDGWSPDGSRVRVTGRYRAAPAASEFDIAAANAPAPPWGAYFVRVPGLDWAQGRFGGHVHLSVTGVRGGLAIDFLATLHVVDAAVHYRPAHLTFEHVAGPVTVDGEHAETTGLSGRANGSPLVVDGSMVFAGGPWIQIGLRSPDMDLAAVQALFFPRAALTLTGTAAGALQIVGPLRALDVDGEISGARGRLNGEAFAGLQAGLHYAAGTMSLVHLTSSAGGGRVAGDIVIDTGGGAPRYLFTGTTRDVDLRALAAAGISGLQQVSGRMSGHLVGVGEGTRMQVMGDVTVGVGTARGVAFDTAHAIFWHGPDGTVDLDYLRAQLGDAAIYSSGRVSGDGSLSLDLSAHDVPLADFGARAGLTGGNALRLDGHADLAGRATGSTAAPVFSGTVVATHGRVGPLAFTEAQGSVTIAQAGLTTPHLDLQNGRARYRVSGGLRFHQPSAQALRVEADDVDAQVLTAALPQAPEITGTLGGTLVIDGSLARPAITGRVTLDHGSVRGQRIDHADVRFAPDPGRINLAEARVVVNSSTLEAAGTIDPAGPIDLRLSAENIHLANVAAAVGLPLPADGIFTLTGGVQGTLQDPIVSGQVRAPAVVVRGETFAASGAMDYEGGVLRLAGLQLAQGSSRYRLSGEVRGGRTPTVGLVLEVEQGRVATVLSAAGIALPARLDGTVDGRIELAGPLDDPAARLSLTLRDATFGAYAIGGGIADLTMTHRTIDIERFEIHPTSGTVAAQGRLDLTGDSAVEVSAQDIDPDFLRPFLQLDRPLEGRLNFTLQFTGPTRDPKAGVSLEAFNTGIAGVDADRIAALAFYSAGTLTIEQGVISKGQHKLIGLGTLAINRTTLAPDPRGPLALQLRLQDTDLSFLTLLTPKITDASGTVAGQINVGGTLASPSMAGFLRSTGGRLHYEALRTPVEDLNIDLAFSQDQIQVRDLSATFGQGRAAASGTVAIANLRPDTVRLAIKADHATVDIPDLYTGQLDAALALAGPAARPVLSGTATLQNGVIVPGGVGGGTGARGAVPPLGLDVTLEAGRNTLFTLGAVRAQVEGSVHVGGTLAAPRLSGRATSRGGEVAFLGTTFRLTGGEAVFSEALGVEPQISARAQQVYGDTVVFLDVTGPATHPELTLTANPPMAQEDIIGLVARNAGIANPETVLGQGLGQFLFGPVREALHLSEFTLTYSRESPVTLRIGKFLLDNVYVSLSEVWPGPVGVTPTVPFTAFPRQLLAGQSYAVGGLEYLLSSNLSLMLSADTLGENGIFVITRFLF